MWTCLESDGKAGAPTQEDSTVGPLRRRAPEKLGFITDVSTRGVYISTNTVFPQGSVVHLHVQLPGGEHLLLQGRVMRARRVASSLVMMMSGGMGVRLENPPPNWRASLSLEDE